MGRESFSMVKFSARLKELRTENDMKQEEIADILGVTKSTISRYEANLYSPKISHIKHLAEVFKVNPKWLAGLSETEILILLQHLTNPLRRVFSCFMPHKPLLKMP